jgi:hypothetical protein
MADKMTNETLSAIVKGLLDDSIDYTEELGEMRMATTQAYNGDPYGNEVEGRSQVVTREVRDAVEVAKPSLMRIFFGSHRVLEYAPNGPEDVETARDATVYMEHVINDVNSGYMEFLSAVDDALIRKSGVFKSWWEVSETPVQSEHTGLTQLEIDMLEQDPEVVEIEVEESGEQYAYQVPGPGVFGPDGQPLPPDDPEPIYDATVTRITTKGRLRFMAVPAEEFVIHRKARNIESSRLVGHYRNVTFSDLREMGYPEEELEGLAGSEEDQDLEKEIRSIGTTTDDTEGETDASQREVPYGELWVRVDYDGDGVAELRRVCVAGSGCRVLENELADEAPLSVLCPSPVAHQAIGRALAELVEDIQKIKTMVLRNTLDSLASAIHPDVAAVTGEVNFDDLLNTERGRILRQNRPGMIEYLTQPFVGEKAFPIMQYLDTLAEARTGMNEASQGLNADALQSTATSAIDNATQAAMSRIEFIARTMIEGGLKRFFKIMLKLATENMDRPTMVRLNDRFIPVDPRAWKASMDVKIAVPLGNASLEQRLTLLQAIASKQEQAIAQGGPDNPVAGIKEYTHTLIEIARLGGIVDPHRHFKDPDDPASQPQPQPPAPDPHLILAEAEATRVQQDGALKMQELELKIWEAIQKDDRERDKAMADVMLRAAEAKAKGQQVDMQAMRNEIERSREGHQYALGLIQQLNQARQQQAAQQQQQPPQGAQ